MVSVWRRIRGAVVSLVMAGALWGVPSPAAHASLGDQVTNIATVSQDSASGRIQISTNPATFTIEARTTPSQIDFLRVASGAPDAVPVHLNGSQFSPTGSLSGPYQDIDLSDQAGLGNIDPSTPVMLVPADMYLSGDLMIVRVIDHGQNGAPSEIETVQIVVTTDHGDTITLRMFESGPDTGEFFAYFISSADASALNDDVITAPQNTVLTATYSDVFDASEVSIDTALVDPFGVVFDSFTGELLNGVTVTIVDAGSGTPATVYGSDGVSAYPASVTTGEEVSDSSGRTYELDDGEFLFPLMPPGDYRLIVGAPAQYIFPSVRVASEFTSLANAPFEIIPGSYGPAFTVSASGPLNMDVPLDPNGDIIARKEASEERAAIGDMLGYSVELENAGTVPAPFLLQDRLPRGVRYVQGTARRNGAPMPDPAITSDGRTLSFADLLVLPDDIERISYMVSIGPGAREGEMVNTAVALNANGEPLSNAAEATIELEDDMLRSRLTIVGRVAEAACRPEDDWARTIENGLGVPGVRLYMENGRYTVTDEDGLFHFEGVTPGSHVVQVDEATLPNGYEPVICEENSRYAGSAISKFVDAQGGMIWRANFYLRPVGLAPGAPADTQPVSAAPIRFDQAWLDVQGDATPRWISPEIGETPEGRSVSLAFLHGPQQRVKMSLNGHLVSGLNFKGTERSSDQTLALSRWSGVDIQRGENVFTAALFDQNDQLVARETRSIWFVDEVDRATLVADQSLAIADGRTRPIIAIRLENAAGHGVHAGRLVAIDVDEPYRLAQAAEMEYSAPVASAYSSTTSTRVDRGGIAYVELEPTLQAGRVRLHVPLNDGRTEEVEVWLQPEQRKWVLVGLAEANGMLSNLDGEDGRDLDEVMRDGRLAFFAKGVVKGDWLLTLAVDTAKRRGVEDGELFDRLDPNAYYTLYGDRTWQYNDAESRYPVYVKLEKDTFQALFGDFETSLTDTQLGRYNRRLSGLKADYQSQTASVTAFAAETNQRFVKDELVADGTSGPFRLSQSSILRSSETISIETRDRFRPDQVLATQLLSRFIDYEIDYATGELFFRHPIAAADTGLNPKIIVIDYEITDGGDRSVTAGARAALRTPSGNLETGMTMVFEDGRSSEFGQSELIGVDTTIRIGSQVEIRAEAAASRTQTQSERSSGQAWLVEATRRSEKLSVSGYYREETEGFGLGQQTSASSAIRRIGAQISAELGVTDLPGGNDRSVRRLEAQAYREESLKAGSRRDVADLAVRQDSQAFGASIGLRAVAEDFAQAAAPRQSVLLTSSVRKSFVEHGLTFTASHEEPLYGGGASDDEVTVFPARTVLGLDKTLGNRATLNIRHEVTNGGDASGNNTQAGITWTPLSGTSVHAGADMITRDAARRIGATVGVDQTWQIDEQWSLSAGLARRADIDNGDNPLDAVDDGLSGLFDDGVRNPLVDSESYTSAHWGASYRGDKTAGSGRVEWRDSQLGKRTVITLGGAREVSETLSFSAVSRFQKEHQYTAERRESLDLRVGLAWRPRGEGLVVLNRFDIGHDRVDGVSHKTKVVNNLAINAMLGARTQGSLYHGLKYVEAEYVGAHASGFTHLLGGELRHDLTPKLDVGLQAFWTSVEASQTQSWAIGPSLGFTPKPNVWISFGWNIEGFEDADFEAGEYTRSGPYIKLRAKFDQDTFKGLVAGLGLGARD